MLCLGGMTWMSWGKWPDLVIDFGNQIYVAWRLSEGDVLYRDITYFMGPLSSYVHGFLFKGFGPSFQALTIFNLLLVASLTVLIYGLFTYLGDRLSGTLSALAFITIFAFAQYSWMGNHNFVVSYVYDLTHGIFLCFLSFYLFKQFALRGTSLSSAGMGFFTGLIFLTKFEVFLAWAFSLTLGFMLIYRFSQLHRRKLAKHALAFFAASALPPGAFLIYFSLRMPFKNALEAIIAPWSYVFGAPSIGIPFYKNVMGMNQLAANMKLMAFYFLVWAVIFVAIIIAGRLAGRYFNRSNLAKLLLLCLVPGVVIIFQGKILWLEALRPLPLIVFLFAVYRFFIQADFSKDPSQLARLGVLLLVTAFSVALLAKIIFKVHVYHYGAALAMPATLVLVHILFYEVPRSISRTPSFNVFYISSALILFLLFTYSHVRVSSNFYMKKAFPVGKGPDMMIGYDPRITPRSMMFRVALEILEEEVEVDESIATFPTGALLNYMARRVTPVKSLSFNPVIFKQIGEPAVLEDLNLHPPDYIVIIFHDYLEFEYRFFGVDFGKGIYDWVQKNYYLFRQIGRDPVKDKAFGIQIFKRNPPEENS